MNAPGTYPPAPAEPQTCTVPGCSEPLTMEMERDATICVECQHDILKMHEAAS